MGASGSIGGTGPQGSEGPQGSNGIQGYSAPVMVSPGIVLDQVNLAKFMIAKPGLNLISSASRAGAAVGSPGGAFDATGCGTGNTDHGNAHFIGIVKPAGDPNLPVASLTSLTVTGRMERGSVSKLRFMLVVDCNADGKYTAAADAVVVTDPSKTNLGSTLGVYTVNATDAAFAAVGGVKCGLPADGISFAALSSLTSGAKLIMAQPQICGVPSGVMMSPVVLVQGDNADVTFRHSLLQMITVKTSMTVDTYTL